MAARIYRVTDKISYKVGEIEFKISPLNVHDKAMLHDLMQKAIKGDTKAALEGSVFALKAGLKDISGIEDSSGNAYKLEFEGNYVTDSCIDDLLNLDETSKIIAICSQLIAGMPRQLPEGISLVEKKN